jgi:hypothetical protein
MYEEKSVPALRLVIPMPVALYCSNGLLFELYEGGQPCRRHQIVWERLRTIEEPPSTSASADQARN